MRVLLTTDCVGGVWTFAMELATALAASDCDVVLAVMGGELADDQRAELDNAPVRGWYARPYRLEWMPEPEDDLASAGRWLLGLAADHDVDVVHLNQFSHAALPWSQPVLVGAHSDVVTWWRAVHGDDPGPQWAPYRERVAAALASADAVVAPTAAYLDALTGAFDVQAPAAVVPNGRHRPQAALPKQPQILAAGRVWDEAKNVATAVAAARGQGWPLLVAGDGPAGNGATFLGRVPADDLAALQDASSIFVAPALYEPFGLAALEAALAGCALVLGDIATLREVWGDAALFVPPDDAAALRRVLQDLAGDAHLLAERQAAATARAGLYTPERMAAAYLAQYRSLTSAQARRVAS